jgi:hypothetical protein
MKIEELIEKLQQLAKDHPGSSGNVVENETARNSLHSRM